MTELKPCPFCGREMRIEHEETGNCWTLVGHKENCFLFGDEDLLTAWFDFEVMVEAWNRRDG